MDGNQNGYWNQHSLSSPTAETGPPLREPQHLQRDFYPSIYSNAFQLSPDNPLRPAEGDQVVPSSQRKDVLGTRHREAKPLPPLPDPEEFMQDEEADCEVEFFTSDRQRLLPKSCAQAMSRGSKKDCGLVNYAYKEGSSRARGAAFSWPNCMFGADCFSFNFAEQRKDDRQSEQNDISCSGLPPPAYHNCEAFLTEKPQIPPRIPIPPKPCPFSKARSFNEEEKPPKVPPRVPLVPPCPPRTPSPKCLPIYINGVMPVTQSFAANPKYVSKTSQRPRSEAGPPAAPFPPCIVPILKDGKQASATHYILLPPGRATRAERRERLMSEPNRTGRVWQKR